MEKNELKGLSLLNQFVNIDRERYMVYKTSKENGIDIPQGEDIYMLEVLDLIGFDINNPGTYLFRELVSEICGCISSSSNRLTEIREQAVKKDLESYRPSLYRGISDRLGIKEEGFIEYVHDAVDKIEKDCADKELRKEVLGLNFRDKGEGALAFNAAQYYRNERKTKEKKSARCMVKEIGISESI